MDCMKPILSLRGSSSAADVLLMIPMIPVIGTDKTVAQSMITHTERKPKIPFRNRVPPHLLFQIPIREPISHFCPNPDRSAYASARLSQQVIFPRHLAGQMT